MVKRSTRVAPGVRRSLRPVSRVMVGLLAYASMGEMGRRALQTGMGSGMEFAFLPIIVIFAVVVIIIVVAFAKTIQGGNAVQRPASEATSFMPPPPPDTIMVRCDYCGTQQTWKEKCVECGAPMPKPQA